MPRTALPDTFELDKRHAVHLTAPGSARKVVATVTPWPRATKPLGELRIDLLHSPDRRIVESHASRIRKASTPREVGHCGSGTNRDLGRGEPQVEQVSCVVRYV